MHRRAARWWTKGSRKSPIFGSGNPRYEVVEKQILSSFNRNKNGSFRLFKGDLFTSGATLLRKEKNEMPQEQRNETAKSAQQTQS